MAGIGTGLTCGAMSAGSNIYKNREQRNGTEGINSWKKEKFFFRGLSGFSDWRVKLKRPI